MRIRFSLRSSPSARGGTFAPPALGIRTHNRGYPGRKREQPLNLRGLGGAQSGIALYTLGAATSPRGARRVLALNVLVDAFDAGVSMLEIRDRRGVDRVAAGGVF